MSWPNEIFVATSLLGVYYTDDFITPAIQPTWSAINSGLPTLDCIRFELDSLNEADRQYVLLGTDRTVYRREDGGNWIPILSPADCRTLIGAVGGSIGGLGVDKSTGRVLVTYGSTKIAEGPRGYYVLYSDNYGDSWNYLRFYSGTWTYGLGSAMAHGDNLYAGASTGMGGNSRIYFTVNGGMSWGSTRLDPNLIPSFFLNPLLPDRVYSTTAILTAKNLAYVTNIGTLVNLQAGLAPGSMWFDSTDANHQRLIDRFNNRLFYTYDGWATYAIVNKHNFETSGLSPYAGTDKENILFSLSVRDAQRHVIGATYGETNNIVTGIAGESPATSPYLNSIPGTCGSGIVRAVGISSGIYTYGVDFEDALAGNVYPFGVEFGEELEGEKVFIHSVEMEY